MSASSVANGSVSSARSTLPSGAMSSRVKKPWLICRRMCGGAARYCSRQVYLRSHVRDATLSAVAVLTLALVIAYLLYLPLRLTRPAEFRAQGSVWVHALGARPKGRVPWVGLQLKDGKLVEGLLHSCSLSEGPLEERDVALGRLIRVTLAQGQSARCLDLDRLVVPGNEISYIAIVHVRER